MVIVSLLFLFCLYPGQAWMAHFLPNLAGLASIEPGLIVLGTPFRLLFSIDLVLVPILFVVLYALIISIDSIGHHQSIGRNIFQRFAALLSGVFFFVASISVAALISYVLVDQLPARAQNSISAVCITAVLHLPFLGYPANTLQGNILSLLGLLVGIVLFITRVARESRHRRSTPLTRQQRITPYQRMLYEKRRPGNQTLIPDPSAPSVPEHHASLIPDPAAPVPKFLLCRNQPLQTLEPEAVNYRPLG